MASVTANKELWDVAVIGGGAAGMMAAGRAAACGARVILIEKNPTLGKKLLITGGGRCNVTNAEFDTRVLLGKYNRGAKNTDQFLFSPFSKFGVPETLAFFHGRSMPTKTEALKRVFPESNSAQSVWDMLSAYMKEGGVTIRTSSPVKKIQAGEGAIAYVELANGQKIYAKRYVLATGGKSRPETGSSGDGFTWMRALGHTVREPSAALVPLSLKDTWVKGISGVSLENAKLTLTQHGKKFASSSGKMLFTHVGISGPAVLNISKDVGEMLRYDAVTLTLDLVPDTTQDALARTLHETLRTESNKMVKNVLASFIPSGLVPVVLTFADTDPETQAHSITREARLQILKYMKALPLQVKGLLGVEKAIVTSGGVALTEIDFQTMRSRLFSNLHLVGDMLDIDRPSGGYSLQLCWTTGYVAGERAAVMLREQEV